MVREFRRIGVCAVLALSLAGPASASLLSNGDAETALGSEWVKDGSNVAAIATVQTSSGSPNILPHGGLRFFSFCEAPSAWGTLTQRGTDGLDETTLVLCGYFTHSAENDDYGSVAVSFYDAVGGGTPISTVSSAALVALPAEWTYFSLPAPVPANAKEWAVELRADKNPALGSYADVFFDDLELVPEPATLALVALGGLGVLARRRRK